MLKNKTGLNMLFLGLFLLGTKAAIADIPITLVRFTPPPDNPQPEKTALGGRRNGISCETDKKQQPTLTVLVPESQKGLTTEQYPTLWVYVPSTSAKQLVLSVKEQENGQYTKHHSQRFFPIPSQPGLVGLKMSDKEAPLEDGKTYKWAVVLVCGKNLHPNDPAIESLVSRVNLSISQPQSLLKQSAWYGEKGVWYDSLELLAKARQASPNNQTLANNWAELLKSVGLESVATAPLYFANN